MSASWMSQFAYDGTRCCVGKIMLRKSPPVMRTHSCGSSAPIGCIAWNPGITSSTMSSCSCDVGDARVGPVGRRLGRWQRTVDLPRERHAVGVVLCEQVVEDRGAGARLPDDEDRRHDVGVGDLGVLLAPLDETEADREVVDDLAGDDLLAQLVQRRFRAAATRCSARTRDATCPRRSRRLPRFRSRVATSRLSSSTALMRASPVRVGNGTRKLASLRCASPRSSRRR